MAGQNLGVRGQLLPASTESTPLVQSLC